MSDLIGRMIDRGRGGGAAASLPLVRPLPTVYAPADDPGLVELGEEVDAPRPVRRDPAVPPAPQPQSPARIDTPGRPVVTALSPVAEVAVPPEPLATPHVVRPPAPLEEVRRDPVAPSSPLAAAAATLGIPGRQSAEPAAPRDRPAFAADAPRAPPMTLEEIADTILSTPPARPPVRPTSASAASAAAEAGPVVTIGRIDIQVAEPVPPRAAAPARTRGFQAYARLRRGLER
ncbi:MAG: hypothetical protein ACRC67_08700 [Inquilinus sp.]|uniref:hypothetical protein n=1 Tax=Inquilinus sp. TaxID=1932117 RepID=UPI003F3ED84F